jgi:ubiquinol-cytochrome c reductase cytochrome b subunit
VVRGGVRGLWRPVVLAGAFAMVTLLGGWKLLVAKLGVALPNYWFIVGFDAKFWGVVVMGAAVIILFFLPWLDHSPVKSIRYRPAWHKYVLGVFVVLFLILGWLGTEPPSDGKTLMAQVGTVYYFGFFLLMPWWSRLGEFKPVPERVVFQAH